VPYRRDEYSCHCVRADGRQHLREKALEEHIAKEIESSRNCNETKVEKITAKWNLKFPERTRGAAVMQWHKISKACSQYLAAFTMIETLSPSGTSLEDLYEAATKIYCELEAAPSRKKSIGRTMSLNTVNVSMYCAHLFPAIMANGRTQK
jgi:hypothetical protein